MFKREAVVQDIKDGEVILSFSRDKACGCCSNLFCGSSCRTVILVKESLSLKKGDRVEVGLESKASLCLSAIIFFIPAVLFILFILVFRSYGEFASFILALTAVLLYFFIVKITIIGRLKDKFSCKIIRLL